jgi:hypothetical protein
MHERQQHMKVNNNTNQASGINFSPSEMDRNIFGSSARESRDAVRVNRMIHILMHSHLFVVVQATDTQV